MTDLRPALRRVAALSVLLLACGGTGTPADGPRAEIRNTVVSLEVVATPESQQRGLGGRDQLAWDRGMLFVYSEPRFYAFWMKDMHFDIDIVWIRGDRIVDLHHRVPAPDGDDEDLPTYRSGQLCDRVLEVPAGYAQAHGWRPGDFVAFHDLP
jgi:uncharacterized membrane protein (UPF0127 family)